MKIEHVLFITENRYQKSSVPNCTSGAPETGRPTGFLVPVFGADFWYMCHLHKAVMKCSKVEFIT